MVPMFCTTSSRDMPMPLSEMVMVRPALSKPMRIFRSESSPNKPGALIASKRSLSQASDALEINSRRKISLLLYKEWIISFSSCLTSAWKPRVSFVVSVCMVSRSKWNFSLSWDCTSRFQVRRCGLKISLPFKGMGRGGDGVLVASTHPPSYLPLEVGGVFASGRSTKTWQNNKLAAQ